MHEIEIEIEIEIPRAKRQDSDLQEEMTSLRHTQVRQRKHLAWFAYGHWR